MKRPAASSGDGPRGGRPAGSQTTLSDDAQKKVLEALKQNIRKPEDADYTDGAQDIETLKKNQKLLIKLRSITDVIPAKSILVTLLSDVAFEKEATWKLADALESWASQKAGYVHLMLQHVANAARKQPVPKWVRCIVDESGDEANEGKDGEVDKVPDEDEEDEEEEEEEEKEEEEDFEEDEA
eukprot:9495115-Pyramimonas_sp.AAC.1